MSRKRSEITKDIEKFNPIQTKLRSNLEVIERKESEALGKIEGELIETGTSKASSDLVKLRISKGVCSQELVIISARLSALQRELKDLESAELLKPWFDFQSALPTRVGKIQSALGALKNEIDGVKKELDSLSSQAEKSSQDGQIVHRNFSQLCATWTAELSQFQKVLDEFEGAHLKK